MEITASLVRDLREASGAGMMDCKNAEVQNYSKKQGGIRIVNTEYAL